MLALVRRDSDFAGIIGTKTNVEINGEIVCVGDVVRVGEGSNNNECVGVVGVFTDKISVMGLGGTPISKLNVVEVLQSHKILKGGSTLHQGYYEVRRFIV